MTSRHCTLGSLFGRADGAGRTFADVMALISIYGASYVAVSYSLVFIHHVVSRRVPVSDTRVRGR